VQARVSATACARIVTQPRRPGRCPIAVFHRYERAANCAVIVSARNRLGGGGTESEEARVRPKSENSGEIRGRLIVPDWFSKPPPSASRPPSPRRFLSIRRCSGYGNPNLVPIVPEIVPVTSAIDGVAGRLPRLLALRRLWQRSHRPAGEQTQGHVDATRHSGGCDDPIAPGYSLRSVCTGSTCAAPRAGR
jgi:hypothetical protein